MRPLLFSLPLYLLACGEESKDVQSTDTGTMSEMVDNDGDGFTADTDCDDDNADVNPDASESCDGVDNDCDGLIDDEDDSLDLSDAPIFFEDQDGDGFGTGEGIAACTAPEETVDNDLDCDDGNADVNPDAAEVCDGMDNDCDALVDDQDDSIDTSTMMTGYTDNDGDGEGDPTTMTMACVLPDTLVFNGDDCDDTDATVGTNAVEICDGIQNQCNATALPNEELDDDGDGYVECSIAETGWQGDAAVVGGEDCDDDNAAFFAVADWFYDDDGDGFGDDSTLFVTCVPPPNGYVLQGGDCDDGNAYTHPNATELCDGVYNDCSDMNFAFVGAPDDETDNDGDGFVECTIDSTGWSGSSSVVGGDDCNDSNILHHEIQDWYMDVDGDGFGNANTPLTICTPPSSIYTLDNTDCNDSDANTYSGAPEICDGLVNDCDSTASLSSDEIDDDGDGFVECSIAFTGWNGVGTVVGGEDCNDDEPEVYPLSVEVCDGLDNDCDGLTDDEDSSWDRSTGVSSYTDSDGDGDGDPSSNVQTCTMPSGNVSNSTDCDDTDDTLNTQDLDQDGLTSCGEDTTGDGSIDTIDCDDSDGTVGAIDLDGDGFIACLDDCNDNDANATPIDNDGDGLSSCDGDCDDTDATIGLEDNDGDGFSACLNDCDDSNPNAYPGAAFNEADPTLCLEDNDGDGYGNYIEYLTVTCIDFELYDSYGDGWNGNQIDIYEDGALTGSYANENLDGISNNTSTGGETSTDQHCFDANTTQVDMIFVDGSYNTEVEFTIYNSDTNDIIGFGEGANTEDLIWEGTTYTDGDTFWSFDPSAMKQLSGGTDCDDTDASYTGDEDGDGAAVCVDDCDDSDAALNPNTDSDMDGYSTCEDCDDTDATVHPDAEETWYDGVDQNCDALNDFDQDEDGYEVDFYTDANGVVISHGGLDCRDDNDAYTPLAMEAVPTACYYDSDGDGYGDDTPSTTAEGYGVIAGTDCYDFNDATYPGAAYMELDVDGDGVTDCTRDSDGDGYGDANPSSWYNALSGSDCDDADADTIGDDDLDGYTTCADANGLIDCNDNDAYTYPGAGFNESGFVMGDYTTYECVTDADGDGYAPTQVVGCYTFELADTYGDGWNAGMNIEVLEDGVSVGTATVTSAAAADEVQSTEICVVDGSTVEFVFNDGSYALEMIGTIYDTDGTTVLGTLTGTGGSSGTQTLNYSDGVSYLDGETFYTATVSGSTVIGSDSDDSDASVQ